MKYAQHTTSEQAGPSLGEMGSWFQSLLHLHQRLSPRFARPEVHLHALLYLQAVLNDIPRKNGWQIAEHVRQARPYGLHRLLSRAIWDEDGVRDDLRAFVCQTLHPLPLMQIGAPLLPVLVIDESGFPKRGLLSSSPSPKSWFSLSWQSALVRSFPENFPRTHPLPCVSTPPGKTPRTFPGNVPLHHLLSFVDETPRTFPCMSKGSFVVFVRHNTRKE